MNPIQIVNEGMYYLPNKKTFVKTAAIRTALDLSEQYKQQRKYNKNLSVLYWRNSIRITVLNDLFIWTPPSKTIGPCKNENDNHFKFLSLYNVIF